MPKNVPFEKGKQGEYLTAGLSEKDFMRVFNVIAKEQSNNRQNAKNTLQPQRLSRKSVEDLVRIGKRADGTAFTIDDLKRFAKMRDKYRKRRSGTKGIYYYELIADAREIDIKRASGASNDGLQIYSSSFARFERGNILNYRVKASPTSKHHEHRVKIRLEDWEEALEQSDGKSYDAAVRMATRGHMSIECTCGRHQFWYRYMATVGGYQLGRNREMAFPKVRNPNLKGTACKHVIQVAKKLQSTIEHKRLVRLMEKQAISVGFTDSGKGSTYTARKNEKINSRGAQVTERQLEQAKAEYAKYKARKASLVSKVKSNPKQAKAAQDKIKRLKSEVAQSRRNEQRLQSQIDKLKKQQKQQIKNKLKSQVQTAINVAVQLGATQEQAVKAYSKNSGISEKAINEALKS